MTKINKYNLKHGIHRIVLKNDDVEVELLNVGASIYKIFTKNYLGKKENIILSLETPNDYLKNDSFVGVSICRNSGRIENASFQLNKKIFNLPKNDGMHNNHSSGKIQNEIFKYTTKKHKDSISVTFTKKVKNMEDGFFGKIIISIKYTLAGHTLIIDYDAIAPTDTICNLTNHSYFNLDSIDATVMNHELSDSFRSIWKLDSKNIPIKKIPFKPFLSNGNRLSDIIQKNPMFFKDQKGIDHPLELFGNKFCLISKLSKKVIEVTTTYPYVVLYTQNFPINGLDGIHKFVTLETQYLPNDINIHKEKSETILRKNQKYKHQTTYTFKMLDAI